MIKIKASQEYSVPPEKLWDLIVDFGNIEAWWPEGTPVNILRVELEGDGVGMTRHIFNEGMPAPVSERLDALDHENRSWKLSIVGDRPVGLIRYSATGSIRTLGNGKCEIEYLGEFEASSGFEDVAEEFLRGAYEIMFTGLDQATAAYR